MKLGKLLQFGTAVLTLGLLLAATRPATRPASRPTGVIQGRVMLNGQPKPGALVRLHTARTLGAGSDPLARATTDKDGLFTFSNLAARKDYVIRLVVPSARGNLIGAQNDIVVEEGQTTDIGTVNLQG